MTRILNLNICSIRKDVLLEQPLKGILFTPNVDHLVRLQHDRAFYDAYKKADWVICDSVILQRMSLLLKDRIIESIPGSTFFHEFCDFHRHDENCRIFILGGKKGVAQLARQNINQRVGRELVVGAHSPSFSFVQDRNESMEIIQMINNSEASVLMVCATSPKQELWIAKYYEKLPHVGLF